MGGSSWGSGRLLGGSWEDVGRALGDGRVLRVGMVLGGHLGGLLEGPGGILGESWEGPGRGHRRALGSLVIAK